MIEIGLSNVTKNYGFNNVLENISFDIKTNERVALIGNNGCGKSTLLKLIAGLENLSSGTIAIRQNRKLGILNQIPNIEDDDIIVKNVLYRGISEILELKEKLEKYESKLIDNPSESVLKSYGRLQEEFINKDGYEIDSYVNKVASIFKIGENMLERRFGSLSGGEKTIVCLAKLILEKPDILLLDEPTNHLDIKTLEWLEQFLINYKGTILIISHDRYFLDKVVTKTILIERKQIEIFHGNYSYFLKENENRIMQDFKNYNNQQKEIAAMKESIKKLREWGQLGDNERFFKRANCIEKRLEKMEKLSKPLEKMELPLSFDSNRSGKDVLIIDNLNIGFNGKLLLSDTSLKLYYQDRLCIMGNNGSGKTSIVNYILSENVKLGSNVKIGYIPQEIHFQENITVLEYARDYFIGSESNLRSALAKFLFYKELVYKKLFALSGGEKVRLKLFALMQTEVNLLILDEPTNHIDIDTKETLENALLEYKGTILFISHDRYFINKIATRIVNIEDHKLVNYIGNYDDYRNQRK